MSLSGVSQKTVHALWQTHCSALAPLSYDDPTVGELWQLFAGFLSHLPLSPVTAFVSSAAPAPEHSGAFIFSVDLSGDALSAAMREALAEQPRLLVPLLEFFRAVLALSPSASSSSSGPLSSSSGPLSSSSGPLSSSSGPLSSSSSGPLSSSSGPLSLSSSSSVALSFPGAPSSLRVHAAVYGGAAERTPFASLGAARLGRLVAVRGAVVRLAPARLRCVRMAFRCGSCGAAREAPSDDGALIFPGPCGGKCRGYRWAPHVEGAECEALQVLQLQEQTERFDAGERGGEGGGGNANRMAEVELRGVWIDAVTVGEVVTVCGVLNARRGDGAEGAATQHIVVRALSICGGNVGSGRSGARGEQSRSVANPMRALMQPPTDAHEERGRFYEMARHPEWFSRLCQLLAPSIYGLSHVKAAIVLAIIGGTEPKPRTRSNIHLLMVGDPGLGKSQLLRAACEMAPRSAFVCAHTSSSCGLTLTLTRDPVSGEATFEAGAVVHGDGGITCIDEIDKGVTEHKALLEVMEQETVSIAKAGMIFGIPVHTSILAAGNPIGGRFDAAKGLAANLNLSTAFLTRFDIVVCLRSPHAHSAACDNENGACDAPHVGDNGVSRHVLELHRYRSAEKTDARETNAHAGLSLDLARRFIAFCRDYCQPVLREDASAVLSAAYLARRGEARAADDDLPVTPRFLQSLIRIAEARAKVELRHEVTAEDARYAVKLLQQCAGTLREEKERGSGDGLHSSHNRNGRKRSQRDFIVDALKTEVSRTGVNALSHRVVLSACEDAGCRNAAAMLKQLNEVGTILQKGDKYQLRGV